MSTDYSFSGTFEISLLQNGPLQSWTTGTLVVNVNNTSAQCILTLPDQFGDSINLSGTASNRLAGTFVYASGSNHQSDDTEVSFSFVNDGFLFAGGYLGGTLYMVDNAAQESYVFVVQGYASYDKAM